MRFTLIPADRTVYVDGDPRVLDEDVICPEGIHAIQWYDNWGEIEYPGTAQNERFFDLSRFQEFVDAHAKAKARDADRATRAGAGT